jgi:GDP-L-fucose synthase
MADACVFLLENRDFKDTYSKDTKEIINTHINIGTGVDISIKELAELMKSIIGFSGELTFNTEKPDGTGSSDFTRRWTVRSLSAP